MMRKRDTTALVEFTNNLASLQEDLLVGGHGADIFLCGTGIDTIEDYEPKADDITPVNREIIIRSVIQHLIPGNIGRILQKK